MINAKGIPNAEKGFALTFSDQPFEGADVELQWLRADKPEAGLPGNWYQGAVAGQKMECWLCPALLLYFENAPANLFV